jgi:type I restriction enzyme S subunit
MSVRDNLDSNSMATAHLPTSWAWVKLGEISERINPGFPSGKHNKNREGIPHLRPMNINVKGEIDLSVVKYVQQESYDRLLKGDVLFNNTNSPELLGKTACVKENSNWAYSNHMTRIRVNSNLVNSCWIAYSLHRLFLLGFFQMNCVHHVNQASVGSTFLTDKISIPFPPLAEQQRIVSRIDEVFTRLDAGGKSLETVMSQLKRYRQSVLKSAFEGKLTEEWRRTHRDRLEPASKLLKRIKEERKSGPGKHKEAPPVNTSDAPELPEKWAWTRLGDMAEVMDVDHKMPKTARKGGIPFLSAKNFVGYDDIDFENVKQISEEDFQRLSRKCKPEPGDLLYSRIGAALGKAREVPLRITFHISYSLCIIRPVSPLYSRFLKWLLKSPLILSQAKANTRSIGVPDLGLRDIGGFQIPIAPLNEQQRIVDEIEQRLSIAEGVEKTVIGSSKQAEKLRQSILKHAFEGKLVPQDSNDEPASVLLERIKSLKTQVIQDERAKKERKIILRAEAEVVER